MTRVVPYAAFLDIGIGRDAMLHIREMSDGFVRRVEDVANVGDEVEVRIVSLDRRRQRIDLSLKGLRPEETALVAPPEPTLEEMSDRARMSEAASRGRGRSDEEMPDMGGARREREPRSGGNRAERGGGAGSYTHLTPPTSGLGESSGVAGPVKKTTINLALPAS